MAETRRLNALASSVIGRIEACLPPGPNVVALSGGADSAVLAWALGRSARSVRAVHVHHGWSASDRLAAAAAELAAAADVEFEIVRVSTNQPGSPEAVARTARYDALAGARVEPELVATAHTRTDQAETVVGNLMWGSGLDGLQGIRRRDGWLARPMLDIDRSEARELATMLGLPFIDDPANDDARFRRVRIRRALSAWERDLAPGVSDRLAALPDLVSDDVAFLEQHTDLVSVESMSGAARIALGALRVAEPAIAARALRRALRALTGMPGSRADVDSVLAVASGSSPTQIGGGFRVEVDGAYLVIGEITHAELGEQALVPGVQQIGAWTWSVEIIAGSPTAYPMSSWTQIFDADELVAPLVVRPVASGDRVAMTVGHKSAGDALSEAGVSADGRGSWPALAAGNEVAWIPGVRRSAVAWVTDATARYLLISAHREERWTPVES